MRQIVRVCAAMLLCLTSIAATKPTTKPADAKSETAATIAVFRLIGQVTESPQDAALPQFASHTQSLKEWTERMRKARIDGNVKGVMIPSEGFRVGIGQVEELRSVMQEIRDAGK